MNQASTKARETGEDAIIVKRVTDELREASDSEIEEAIQFVDPMVLRGLVYQLTGDEAIAATQTATDWFFFFNLNLLADPEDVAMVQRKAADLLKSYRDGEAEEIPLGPRERLPRSLGLSAGVDPDETEIEMWEEHTALDPCARSPRWEERPADEKLEQFNVVVIGAGMGGLHAALELKRLGLPFTVFEKNSEVAGTWHENRYPGARVDTASRIYAQLHAVDFDWSETFATQAENERYFNWVADHYELRENIELNTEVESAAWREDEGIWEIRAKGPDGERVVHANAVFTAVGFLSRPNVPAFEGLEDFEGEAFHTARWPRELDLAGKRVAVIGSGCTSYQLMQAIAGQPVQTYLFQRTPSWVFGVEGYLQKNPPQAQWMERNFPYYTNFSRFRLTFLFGPDCFGPPFNVEPDFEHEFARSETNKLLWEERMEYLRETLRERPDLLEKMTPSSPVLSSRPVLCEADDNILHVLLREDLELVDAGIERITAKGIVTPDGREIPVDVIVFATGFKAQDFLWPMEVRGRGGQTVEELWQKDGPRAYLGAMLPGFPNLFTIYGPNSSPYSGGTPSDYTEYTVRFGLECIRGLIEGEKQAVEVSADAYWRFAEEHDRWEAIKVYMDPRTRTYFHNEHGRSPANAAIDVRKYWGWLRSPTGPRPGKAPIWEGGPVEETTELRPYFGEDLKVS